MGNVLGFRLPLLFLFFVCFVFSLLRLCKSFPGLTIDHVSELYYILVSSERYAGCGVSVTSQSYLRIFKIQRENFCSKPKKSLRWESRQKFWQKKKLKKKQRKVGVWKKVQNYCAEIVKLFKPHYLSKFGSRINIRMIW